MDVSIIVPIYNVSAYIERCILSIMNQTFSGSLECILVNDCTPDDSIQKCEKLIDQYKGDIVFSIVHHHKNKGLSCARNTGTELSKGEYVFYLDSDDEITEQCIELLWNEVIQHSNIDVVMGSTQSKFDKTYYDISLYSSHKYVFDSFWLQYNYFKEGKGIAANAWNKLIRLDFLRIHKISFMPGIIHEDEQWFYYVLRDISSWSFVFSDTYIHYRTPGSIVSTLHRAKEAKNWFKIMLDHSSNFYGPFYTLQLAKYMNMYFNQWMFEYHFPDSRKLHLNFIKACLKKNLWKGAALLSIWTLLYGKRDGFRFKMWLMEYSSSLYRRESDKWSNIYSANIE